MREGIDAFYRHNGVRALTFGKGTFDFFHWGVVALFVLYVVRDLRLSPATLGLIAMFASFGPVLAGAIAAPVSRRFGAARTSVAAACLLGGNLLIPFATGPRWIVIATLIVAGFSVGLGVVYLIILRATMLQRTVAPELLGRVGSVMRLIEWGPGPFGGAVGGLLGQILGPRRALVVLGVGCLLGVPWITVAAVRGHLGSVQD